MRVQLDTGRKTVDLEITDVYGDSFLELVLKALESLDYTEKDVLRFIEDRHDD